MGKQITFFMTHEDEKNFLDAIRQFGPVKVIYNTYADESKMEVQPLQPVGMTSNDANLSLVNFSIGPSIERKFYPSQSYFCIELAESEVVQFNRCKVVKTWLANGRLWFDEKSNRGKKSDAFLTWANSLLKWVRSNYHKDEVGHFVGPRAFELARAGSMQLGPPIAPLAKSE